MNPHLKAAEIARVADMLAPLCDGDEQLFADMMEGETEIDRIVQRLHNIIADDEAMVVGMAARQANLADRKVRINARIEAGKRAIGIMLRAAKLTKLELPEVTYSVRDGKPKLEIVDPAAVPPEFQRMKPEPDKTAINEAFSDAETLPNWLARGEAKDVVTARKT